jgi:hypothetical protein
MYSHRQEIFVFSKPQWSAAVGQFGESSLDVELYQPYGQKQAQHGSL